VSPSPAARRRLLLVWTLLVLAGFLTRGWPGWSGAAASWIADLGRGDSVRPEAALRAVPGHLGSLAGLAALALGWLAAGLPVARWLVPGAQAGDRLVLALAIGAGTFGVIVQGAGLAGLLFVPIILGSGAALAGAGLLAASRNRIWSRVRSGAREAALPAAVCGFVVAAGWLVSRLPDVYEDTAVQHFAIPAQCLAVHRFFAEPANTLWHLSLGGEMVYLPLLALGGITAAKLANVMTAAVLLLVTRRLAAALGADAAGAWWAAAVLGSIAFIPGSCWAGKNDLVAVLFFAAAAWCVILARRRGHAWWMAGGWCLGLAMGVKYTVAYVIPGLAAAAWWPGGWRRRASRGELATAAAAAAAPAGGWFVRNWLTVGNPFHPILSGLFPEPFWNPFYAKAVAGARFAFSTAEVKSGWYPVFAPWDVALDPSFGSPLLGVVLPAALFLGPVPAAARALLGAAYACWVFSERFGRYLAPLLPVVAAAGVPATIRLAAGSGAAAGVPAALSLLADGGAARLRVVAACLVVGLTAARTGELLAPSGWRAALGQTTAATYLRERYTTLEDARTWAAARTTLRDRLLLTGEERALGFAGRVVTSGGVAEPMFRLTSESASAAGLRKRLRELGIRFVLYNHVQAAFRSVAWVRSPEWSRRQLIVYREFMRRYARPAYFQPKVDFANGGFAGWILEREPAAPGFPVGALPQAEGRYRRTLDAIAAGRAAEALAQAIHAGIPGGGVSSEDEILGYCELAVGRTDQARRLFREGIDSGFALRGSLSGFASCLAAAGDLDGAIRWKAREWSYLELGETLDQLARLFAVRARERDLPEGRLAAAVRDLDRAACLVPGDWRSLALAAVVLDRLGRRSEAVWYARRALSAGSREPALAGFAERLGVQ